MKNYQPPAPLDPESLVARIIAELQANPHAQRLLLRALLTNEFLGVPARLDRIEKDIAELKAELDRRFEQVDRRFEQVDRRFEQVDRRFEQVDKRFDQMAEEISNLDQKIDRLGSRWGIQAESVFRRTMATVLEQSFGVRVEQRIIAGEQFDLLIYDHEHVLVEFAASVGRTIRARLERKRRLYEEASGVRPTRVILATASIYSRRAEDLRKVGIEVIEPEEPLEEFVEESGEPVT